MSRTPQTIRGILHSFRENFFFPCRRCFACTKTNRNGIKCTTFASTSTGKEYPIRDFILCRTEGVVYVLQCPCTMQYVERTKRPMWNRFLKHVQNIQKSFSKHSISRYFAQHHDKDPILLLFWAIEKYQPHWRGTNKINQLSKIESK